MILVDTSIWIDHFRSPVSAFAEMLTRAEVLLHPFVLTELALGNLSDRGMVLQQLSDIERCVVADCDEVLRFVEAERLWGSGIGYVDAHVLAAARLTPGTSIWTRDRRMASVATRLGLTAPY